MSEVPVYPQAVTSSFVSRLKSESTGLYVSLDSGRSARRHASQINYAELDREDFLDDDKDEDFILDRYTQNTVKSVFQNHIDVTKFEGKPLTLTKHTDFDENELLYNASLPEVMIPMRISCDYQSNKIVDFFMWNLNEQLVTPEQFASILVQDLDLPNSYHQQVVNQIKQQIEDFQTAPVFPEGETHVIIDLSVSLDTNFYEDKFEWDLGNNTLTPEQFATTVVEDLGLLPEFKAAIAHSLHDTILKLKKEFADNNHLTMLQHYDISKLNLCYQTAPSNTGLNLDQQGLRYDMKNMGEGWSPSVEVLTKWEIEKREIEKERNIRRLKRETMRVGDDFGAPRKRGRRRKDEL